MTGELPETLRAAPITPSFGVEIDVADTGPLVDGSLDWLAPLLADRLVVVLRGAHLDHADQVRLARAIGEPTPAHPVVPGHPDHPEILELDGARGGRNARWHTDVTFTATPPAASVLVADHVPETGGDTMFADLHAAYESLAPAVRSLADELVAVHRITPLAYWGEPFDTAMSRDDAADLLAAAGRVPPVVHPVVRVHPVTGRRALFVNPGFTSHLVGVSRLESEHLLALLHAHTTRPETVLRHRWRPGDVVMWDNRATMHHAVDDYGDAERRMRRVTVRGAAPVGVTGFTSSVVDDPLIAIR
jgi:alpha-ketoglutarate-dependent taurine dioxygenase